MIKHDVGCVLAREALPHSGAQLYVQQCRLESGRRKSEADLVAPTPSAPPTWRPSHTLSTLHTIHTFFNTYKQMQMNELITGS